MATEEKEFEAGQAGWLSRGLDFLSVICLLVAIATYFFNVWINWRVPALSADSLIYHLTIPALWKQEGFLQTVDLPFHDGAAEHSPLFTEVLIYGLMRVTGNDDLAYLVQPVFFLLLVGLLHASARRMGLGGAAARFLASFVLLFPPFFHSSLIVNSELVMTCGVALFCYGMLLSREREAGWYLAAAGIALTFSTKTVGIVYGLVAVGILLAWLWMQRSADFAEGRRFLWIRRAGICAAILLCGLAFHLRNLWEHGNPLYPAEVRVLGMTVLAGRYNASVFVNHGWSPRALSKMLLSDTELYAMNTQFGMVLWLALGVPLALLVLRKLKRADWLPTALFAVFPLASSALYFAVVPFWSEHRLLFPVYYLLWGGLGWSLQLLTKERGELARNVATAALGLAFMASAVFFLLFNQVPLFLLAVAGMAGLIVANYPRLLALLGGWPWLVPAIAASAMVVSSPWWYPQFAAQRVRNRGSTYTQMYGPLGMVWNGFAEHPADQPVTIAYTGTPLIYPLFGPRLSNRVIYLPIHPNDQPGPVTLTKDASIYRQLARQRRKAFDESFWLARLKAEQVDLLIVVQDPKFDDPLFERTFAAKHPELLELKYEQERIWVYEVKKKSEK